MFAGRALCDLFLQGCLFPFIAPGPSPTLPISLRGNREGEKLRTGSPPEFGIVCCDWQSGRGREMVLLIRI
jgi:hypothetical protein